VYEARGLPNLRQPFFFGLYSRVYKTHNKGTPSWKLSQKAQYFGIFETTCKETSKYYSFGESFGEWHML
jgi:hypothetical protein